MKTTTKKASAIPYDAFIKIAPRCQIRPLLDLFLHVAVYSSYILTFTMQH